jgi:hypothetical protein
VDTADHTSVGKHVEKDRGKEKNLARMQEGKPDTASRYEIPFIPSPKRGRES